jgi:hypothetical protein
MEVFENKQYRVSLGLFYQDRYKRFQGPLSLTLG